MNIKDKVFLVTGGGSGIGRALVLELLFNGASVATIDIAEANLAETYQLAGQHKDRLTTYVVDITDLEAVKALPEKVIADHGAVDAIINNAGIIQPFVRVKDLDYSAIDRVMKVNFYGTVYVTKVFLPYLLERPEASITNISSMGSYTPVPGQTIYGAAKAGVKLFTEGLHSELMNTNVTATVIFQGSTETNIAQNSGITDIPGMDAGEAASAIKTMTPEDAARQIVDAIAKDRYMAYVGSDARFMGFLSRLNPKLAAKIIYNQMRSLLPD
jgi:NAD(P)-dependent dehydrogenase (short-subunit alcohol dehydrogenase family)